MMREELNQTPDKPRSPWVVAHRGAMILAPENTRAAFDTALTFPIDGIEFDVQMTKDSVPILYHHRTLSKISGGLRRVSDFSLEGLNRLDWGIWHGRAYQGEKLLTLEQALNLYSKKTRLLIEIKSWGKERRSGKSSALALRVLEMLSSLVHKKHHKNIVILSFDPDLIGFAYEKAPEWRYVLSMREPLTDMKERKEEFGSLSGFCIPIKSLTENFVDVVHAWGAQAITYSCNVPGQVQKALELNVDVIMSDKPGWLVGYLQGRGIRS